MQEVRGGSSPGRWPPALAYWLTTADVAAITEAARAHQDRAAASPALRDALREFDAAQVRRRWFDPPSAASHRRIAYLEPDTIAARLTQDERDALIDCDPTLVAPLLDATTRREPWAGGSDHGEPAKPITLPTLPAGPVVVVTDTADHTLTWALGELDAGKLRTWRADPDDRAWDAACQEARAQHVEVEAEHRARRLVVPGLPALSTLALARPDLRPGAGEALLLRLPSVVVIAPESLAARIAAYTYPVKIRLVPGDALPAVPGRTGVTM